MGAKGKPEFDESRAQALIGRTVIIGLTYLDEVGEVTERLQLHGRIISADASKGFVVELSGEHSGEVYVLPPDLRSFTEASPGEYRLRSSGEIVINPDLSCTWTVTKEDE